MAKLHEALAVDGNLKWQADKVRTEQANAFEKKRHLYAKKIVTFKSNAEGGQTVTEEQSDLQSTIRTDLTWLKGLLSPSLDVQFQIAKANTLAKSDVILDGQTAPLLKDVPATALLELEKRVTEIHTLVQHIPTLDPAKGFTPDPDQGKGVYKAREVVKDRTKKIQRPLTLAKATDKHPEQVQLITEDVVVGQIHEQEWSGLLTTAEKADMLERAEALKRAIKTARARANDQPVDTAVKVGDTLLSYVFGG
jgi:hypothetical protein